MVDLESNYKHYIFNKDVSFSDIPSCPWHFIYAVIYREGKYDRLPMVY